MAYPSLSQRSSTRVVTDTFAGYNNNLKIADGEFYWTENLTSKHYPLLANRDKRGTLDYTFTNLQAIIAKDALYWVDNGTLYVGGTATALTGLQTTEETTLVSMGAYICIFPDKKYYNTLDSSDYGSMEASWSYSGSVSGDVLYQMCQADGTVYSTVTSSDTEPDDPSNGDVWVDTTTNEAKQFNDYTESWVTLETVYTKVTFGTCGEIPAAFSAYDGVEVTGMHNDDLNGSKIIYALGGSSTDDVQDYIVLIGIQGEAYTDSEASITITREVPDMDYVCEAQNRLWGCYYGNNGTENVNEIYCCALGDFKNWSQYLGVSTDSWRASCGSDGEWTGCINYLGSPTFFKENMIHAVTISSVGAHRVDDMPARGVQEGSHKSLAIVNETLYFKSRFGVSAYQGGIPVDVAEALGDNRYYNAVAGVFGQTYYISMQDEDDNWQFFNYNAAKGIWMREDDLHVEGFAKWNDELYAMSENSIIALNGTEGTAEDTPEWTAITGILYYEYTDQKYLRRYDIRLKMEQSATMDVYLEFDSSGTWVKAGTVSTAATKSVTLPVRPRRCDHMRMKLVGSGDVRILSIARILVKGSDA